MSLFGTRRSDAVALLPLHPQPADLAWPTVEWPRAELDPKVDREALMRLLDDAFSEPPPDSLERTHATVIVHRGAIVAERYASDVGPDDTFASWSMAKSVTQALVGILVRQGRLDPHAPAAVTDWEADDPRREISVDQLLRMVDGLRFREAKQLPNGGTEYYPESESDVVPMLWGEGKADVARFAAALPRLHPPEEIWNYNSGGSNLLARIVGDVVGGGPDGMLAFMRSELFEPLGMKSPAPRFDERGTFIGSAFCFCSARDFARFGYLYLRDGIWEGRRILPEGWVDYTRTPTPQAEAGHYGAHFWIYPGSLGMFYCGGAFGQRTIISPALDLVLVRLGNTSPAKLAAVDAYTKAIIDAFRPILG